MKLLTKARGALAFSLLFGTAHAQIPAGMNAPGGAAPLSLVQTLQQSLATMQGQVAGLLSGTGTGTGTGSGSSTGTGSSGTAVGVGIQAALTAANAMPPNVQFILDPAEPASTTASTSASLLLDGSSNILGYVDPINGVPFASGGAAKGSLVANSMAGKAVFRTNSQSVSGGYDAFVNQRQSISDSFFAWPNSTFYFAMSINQAAKGNELIQGCSTLLCRHH